MTDEPTEEAVPAVSPKRKQRKVANATVQEIDPMNSAEITVTVDEPNPEEHVEETVMISHGDGSEPTPQTIRLKKPVSQPWLPR